MMSLIKNVKQISIEVKASAAYAICSIIQKCLALITLPIFTRLLTTEQYGQVTIYSSWSGILTIFLSLNLAYGSFSTAMIKFEDKRNEYISAIQGICLLLTALFLIIYSLSYKVLNKLFELPTIMVLVLVLEIIAQTSIQLWSGKKRFEFKYKSVIFTTLLSAIISPIVAYVLVIFNREKGYMRIVGYSIVTIVIGGIIFISNMFRGKHLYNKEYWKYALSFNVPLLAYYLSQTIFNQSDRIMISHITGASDAALYGVVYNLAMVLTFVLNAINSSYVPWLYNKIKTEEPQSNKPVTIAIAILLAMMIVCVVWYAPEIIFIIAGEQYKKAIYVMAPVSMSLLLLFYAQLFINVEFYYEEKRMLVWASIGAAILNIILNYILIPEKGFVAAGYTTLISYFVFMISNYFAMKSVLRKRNIMDNLYDYHLLTIVLLIFIAMGFLGVLLYNYLPLRILISFFVLVLFIVFKQKFIDILKIIKEG